MSITLLLVLIIVLAFLLGGVLERRLPRMVSRSGIEYALLGILLGSHLGPAVLGQKELATLDPFLQMILGLVGFILGLRTKELFSARAFATAGIVAAVGCFLSATALVGLLLMNTTILPHGVEGADRLLFRRPLGTFFGNAFELTVGEEHLKMSVGIAAAVCVSSLGVGASPMSVAGAVPRFLKASASASQVIGIMSLGLMLAASRATDETNRFFLAVARWSLAGVVFGVLSGGLFGVFIGREHDRMRLFLATVGLVTLASGIGVALGVSPMFINFMAGVTVAATSAHATVLRSELRRLERPLRIIVMVFVGALWLAPPLSWWVFAIVVFLLRWGLKRVWTYIANQWVLEKPLAVRKLGDGVLSQGAVAAAIAASFAPQQTPEQRAWILTTVLVVALLSDLVSEGRWRALLYSAGETDEAARRFGPGSSEL